MKIEIEKYNNQWPTLFEREKQILLKVLETGCMEP
jgi:GrpB-like predicted nucleotidyltransferase (UPF0157 family)